MTPKRLHAQLHSIHDQIAFYVDALEKIAALPKSHSGRKEEEEWNDMEDAYGNGLEAGEFAGFSKAADIARAALK